MTSRPSLKRRILKKSKNHAASRPARICLVAALVFMAVNAGIYVLFLNRTFPNTRIANHAIGSTNYSQLAGKISSLPLLPKAVSLQGRSRIFSVPPAQLGVKVDGSEIEKAARQKSWLPIENLFAAHNLQARYEINRTALAHKLNEIAAADRLAATDAQIALQNNQFTLVGSKNGYQLDSDKAAQEITAAAAKGQTRIKLPFVAVLPKIGAADLESRLQQLRAQQGVTLSYSYNGSTVKVSAATIAGWYAEANGQFQLQPARIQAYINQLGATDGIHVANINDLVSRTQTALQKVSSASLTLVAVPKTICSPNSVNQLVMVSISQQHMWACNTYNLVYDAPVVTGMENFPADLTPTGTFKIYSKQTNLFLNGSDSTGSWHEFVNYWLPFLSNKYGIYGFHDATWRSSSDFGNISPYSNQASHGCVELPLSAARWLYGWAAWGATVSITG